jgi:hypothetical protein
MTLFKRAPIREWDESKRELLEAASKRVSKMNSDDLLAWSDVAASGLMKACEDYMKQEEVASLEEMTEAVITLQAVVIILTERYILTHD